MRVPKSYKFHHLIALLVEQQAEAWDTDETYVVEMALVQLLKDRLPPGFQPEKKPRKNRKG